MSSGFGGRFIAVAAALALLPTAGAGAGWWGFGFPASGSYDRIAAARADISWWSSDSALAARRLFEEYGAPDEIHPRYLVWHRRGPWTETVVFSDSLRNADGSDRGLIEQTLDYALKPDQIDALASFDRSLTYNALTGQLSALSDSEELNYLRMNLADDVACGRLTPLEARSSLRRVVSLSESGKAFADLKSLHVPFGPRAD